MEPAKHARRRCAPRGTGSLRVRQRHPARAVRLAIVGDHGRPDANQPLHLFAASAEGGHEVQVRISAVTLAVWKPARPFGVVRSSGPRRVEVSSGLSPNSSWMIRREAPPCTGSRSSTFQPIELVDDRHGDDDMNIGHRTRVQEVPVVQLVELTRVVHEEAVVRDEEHAAGGPPLDLCLKRFDCSVEVGAARTEGSGVRSQPRPGQDCPNRAMST